MMKLQAPKTATLGSSSSAAPSASSMAVAKVFCMMIASSREHAGGRRGAIRKRAAFGEGAGARHPRSHMGVDRADIVARQRSLGEQAADILQNWIMLVCPVRMRTGD